MVLKVDFINLLPSSPQLNYQLSTYEWRTRRFDSLEIASLKQNEIGNPEKNQFNLLNKIKIRRDFLFSILMRIITKFYREITLFLLFKIHIEIQLFHFSWQTTHLVEVDENVDGRGKSQSRVASLDDISDNHNI